MHKATEAWQNFESPGIDGILPDMIKDGGELAVVKQSLLWLFNCILAENFPERLSVAHGLDHCS